ncbi:MAG TPA: 3-hydroxyacyl-CoA dehydrogenase/enoyl-CoA hydratase family protein [Polyangiaceae bacterium]|jgi:3-hydroxyacyl-CoA dehydrogenase|nr:MAG: putative 3-hydroxyacyl-CoA dehydrogenase [Deltaproteobacteria bacterium ADurb.Bin207]HNS98427.1 3-hydroxyacyl-CoA dehydrogenase/enoyl-CoA hydratase family protein [Polyangiaceae bacterium]HNZ22307.1 3-hydroxyacyl-CoA dehydrogenase/enoyl-CoA hydratase family protein [Polyangiaceae bacterium]HOD20841.1 3-hydroxyacyl-CoA dehydrogenase/enoyl-CoA hydratase family protein [Polyangiaceae bacterium]HOE49121.1 3-hydroxyacyl-CoA dehydrogenase/enoyl-CoA hydratase family protein [Polyangiaceae bact
MNQPFRHVAVLGAGVMGAAIAAHLANAGVRVLLLDIVPPNLSQDDKKDPKKRNAIAVGGLERAVKAKPALFFHPSCASLVRTGNLEDDIHKLADCDLVIEAVPELIDIKRSLFERVEKAIRPGTVVSSNTSGLPIRDLLEGRGPEFRKNFIVTHFFNPVRYMKLLELVRGPETLDSVYERIVAFGQDVLGKGIVVGRDTPNFVGNRIGVYAMMVAIHQMLESGLAPEEVDAVAGPPMGRPKSAAFRTADLVGLDTFVHVADNCHRLLADDPQRDVFLVPPFIRTMVERGQIGNKAKGGFYKKDKAKNVLTLDPATGEYRDKLAKSDVLGFCKSLKDIDEVGARVRKLMSDTGPAGDYAWKVAAKTLLYAAGLVGEICDDVTAIDDAMRWGYNWELGPFEMWDALGFARTVDRMQKDGFEIPASIRKMKDDGVKGFYDGDKIYDLVAGKQIARKTDPRTLPFSIVRGEKAIEKLEGASLWDTGDGVLAVTFHTKANSIDHDVIAMIEKGVTRAENEARALVLFNEGEHFCVGANLMLIVTAAINKKYEDIRQVAAALQAAGQRMKYAKVPVVTAPFSVTVGGGLELCMAAGHVQAAAETYCGLVEVGVGLIPAGGGCTNAMWRALENVPEGAPADIYNLTTQVFKNIALAKVCTSALEGQRVGYFRSGDGITFDKARLLHDARKYAIGLAERGYHPPIPRSHKLFGESGIATFRMMVSALVAGGQATAHDGVVATRLAEVLCGGVDGAAAPVTEERMLELEVEAFLSLCGEEKSIARMQAMLTTNKPLRN